MRIWSIHPKHLDAKGLVALWREGLLAQAVLAGATKGYRNHSQLVRFRQANNPMRAIGFYLSVVAQEAASRGYSFNTDKIIDKSGIAEVMPVTTGQLYFERRHLLNKVAQRAPGQLARLDGPTTLHPLFVEVEGDIETWEKL